MIADKKFSEQPLEFWANVKLISQKVGYTQKAKKKKKGEPAQAKGETQIAIPTIEEIRAAYKSLHLNIEKIESDGKLTDFGSLLISYFQYRANFIHQAKDLLMNKDSAKKLFEEIKEQCNPQCPLPKNKQKGNKRAEAYFTCIINMLIEKSSSGHSCNFDPKELPAFTKDGFPTRSMSRRVDGAFPSVNNPIAVWEIKEYYYTKTFGSRIADGVYESLLDGFELAESRQHLNQTIHHYLMIDDYSTWWLQGRSYLCRICDMLHMGFITEVLFGKEVVERIPQLVEEWKIEYRKRNATNVTKSPNPDREIKLELKCN